MKKLIPFFSFALLLTACNTGTPKEQAPVANQAEASAPVLDTTGLSKYQAWKAQNELQEAKQAEAVNETPAAQPKAAPRQYTSAPKVQRRSEPAARRSQAPAGKNTGSGNSTAKSEGGGMSSESAEAAKAPEKQGMSKATKGAIIGGATGAAAGAILMKKNKVGGAVIGGVVGAIGGHVIGKKMDKKDSARKQ